MLEIRMVVGRTLITGGQILLVKAEATRRQTNCQLRLKRSGEPSRLSLRRQWISSSLRTPHESPLPEEFVPLL